MSHNGLRVLRYEGEDNSKMDLTEILCEDVDLIRVPFDRVECGFL